MYLHIPIPLKELVLLISFLHSLQSIHNYCRQQGNGEDRLKCHQCMKKKFVVVPCTKCKKKMYCIQCIKQWYGIPCTFTFSLEMFFFPPVLLHHSCSLCVYRYPHLEEEEVSMLCPFCRRNCNCNVCLHSSGMIKVCL